MAERKIGDKAIRLVRGDITDMEVEAFVFDITSDCQLGSGYGGAIAQRGGKDVQEALDKVGGLATGQAVLTTAGNMRAKHIIHTNGPKYYESDAAGKLARATESAMRVADANGISQLAFPPIGTGLYKVPLDLSARVMMETVERHLKGKTTLREVAFASTMTSSAAKNTDLAAPILAAGCHFSGSSGS